MSKERKYRLDPQTLRYEILEVSRKTIFARATLVFVGSVALAVLYFFLYTHVLGMESPKLALLKRQSARWESDIEVLSRRLDGYESSIDGIEMRSDDIYRSIFGMSEVSQDLLKSGFGGQHRYDYLADASPSNPLPAVAKRLDVLTKETYVLTRSYDEISAMSRKAGDMASCIPAIPPFCPERGKYNLSSPFGHRTDPVYGGGEFHGGQDFAMKKGVPLYATGDGVVESVNFSFNGYGNEIVINHGFGYKTRYAHLSSINVAEGMSIKRGDCIGAVGNSGKTTGAHLHYEVIYRDERINPMNFVDLDMSVKEYKDLINKRRAESKEMFNRSFRVARR